MSITQKRNRSQFWKTRKLNELSEDEWESLCDGCGKCCLHKLEDENTKEVIYTEVACSLLDIKRCRCTNYKLRLSLVPDCLKLTPESVSETNWLPSTCAYRLINEGKDLYWWHPLISGEKNTVHMANISIRKQAIAAHLSDQLEQHIVEWPNEDE